MNTTTSRKIMEKQSVIQGKREILYGVFVLVGLYLTSHYSYLLFHSLAEIFSIVIACGIFMVAINSRRFLDNNYLLFIGIAYLFISYVTGIIDIDEVIILVKRLGIKNIIEKLKKDREKG